MAIIKQYAGLLRGSFGLLGGGARASNLVVKARVVNQALVLLAASL